METPISSWFMIGNMPAIPVTHLTASSKSPSSAKPTPGRQLWSNLQLFVSWNNAADVWAELICFFFPSFMTKHWEIPKNKS